MESLSCRYPLPIALFQPAILHLKALLTSSRTLAEQRLWVSYMIKFSLIQDFSCQELSTLVYSNKSKHYIRRVNHPPCILAHIYIYLVGVPYISAVTVPETLVPALPSVPWSNTIEHECIGDSVQLYQSSCLPSTVQEFQVISWLNV